VRVKIENSLSMVETGGDNVRRERDANNPLEIEPALRLT
jgi:hypothetical protein